MQRNFSQMFVRQDQVILKSKLKTLTTIFAVGTMDIQISRKQNMLLLHHHELWRVRPSACSLTLKVELVPPSFPRACYISPPFRFILQYLLGCLLSLSTFRMQLFDCCKQLIQTVCPRSHSLRVQVSPTDPNHIKITIPDCTGAFQRIQLQLQLYSINEDVWRFCLQGRHWIDCCMRKWV